MNVDLGKSWMIGDGFRDIGAAMNAGIRSILLAAEGVPDLRGLRPDFVVPALREAVDKILELHMAPPSM